MQEQIDYSPYDGDGRVMLEPMAVLPGTSPIRVARATARLLVKSMLFVGSSSHSGQGGTLWVLLAWLQRHRVHYVLECMPGKGYQIRLVTSASQPQESSLQTASQYAGL